MFGDVVWTSKNIPKSIAICPEALISHFGIINNHKSPQKKQKNPNNPTHRLICFHYVASLCFEVLGKVEGGWPRAESIRNTIPTTLAVFEPCETLNK